MFDFDAGKLLIVGVIALIFIPPKDLPRVLREVGQFVGRMRRMATDFQHQFMDAMREADMADVRREAQKLADSARVDIGFDSVHDLDRQMVAKRPAEPVPEPDDVSEPARSSAPSIPAPHREAHGDEWEPPEVKAKPQSTQAQVTHTQVAHAQADQPEDTKAHEAKPQPAKAEPSAPVPSHSA